MGVVLVPVIDVLWAHGDFAPAGLYSIRKADSMTLDFLRGGELEHLPQFITSLAVGLLIGLERERSPAAKAGLRTFALVALFCNGRSHAVRRNRHAMGTDRRLAGRRPDDHCRVLA